MFSKTFATKTFLSQTCCSQHINILCQNPPSSQCNIVRFKVVSVPCLFWGVGELPRPCFHSDADNVDTDEGGEEDDDVDTTVSSSTSMMMIMIM